MRFRVFMSSKRLKSLIYFTIALFFAVFFIQKILYSHIPQEEILEYSSPNQREINKHCDLTEEAKLALSKAKTEECRQTIMDVSCMISIDQIFPTHLPRFCPENEELVAGCYTYEKTKLHSERVLKNFPDSNSKDTCVSYCLKIGYPLAGLANGQECHCSNFIYPKTKETELSDCQNGCVNGNASDFCGDIDKIMWYSTGIVDHSKHKNSLIMPHSGGNSPIKIVFLLIVSGRHVRQITRLINQIYRPQHYYYIHVDQRNDFLYRELSRLASQVENIRMKQIRFATIWGGNSLLTMILDCIKDLLEISTEWHWDFVVNLSESDFPLFPIEEFEGFLFVNRYRNFLESHNDSGQQYFERQGLDWFFYECDNHLWKMGKRKFPENIRLDGNSDWFALNREFLQYVTFGDDSLVQGLKVYFEYAVFPAESFFQTLLINSKFCNSYTGINLKLVNWQNGRGCGCRETVDWCGCSPLAFRLEAIAQLNFTKLRQEHNYFARKFDPVVDRGSIDWVERNFGNKKHDDHQNEKVIFSSDYWFSDYDYLDKSPSTPAAKILLTKCLTAMALQQYFEKDGIHIISIKPLQLHILLRKDKAFILLKYGVQMDFATTHELEAKFSYISKITSVAKDERLISFEIGTNWDDKEQIFRNYVKSVDINSKLNARIELKLTVRTEVKVQLLNTDNKLIQSITQIANNSGTVRVLFNESLTVLQQSGIWSASVFIGNNLLQTIHFPVLPDVPNLDATEINKDKSAAHSLKMTSEFYTLTDNCIRTQIENDSKLHIFNHCALTDWSSDYPDENSSFKFAQLPITRVSETVAKKNIRLPGG